MPKYRKKPIEVEAVQVKESKTWTTDGGPKWLVEALCKPWDEVGCVSFGPDHKPQIRTLEGVMRVQWGGWIIRGTKGELYGCAEDIFPGLYEEVMEFKPADRVVDEFGETFTVALCLSQSPILSRIPREMAEIQLHALQARAGARQGYMRVKAERQMRLRVGLPCLPQGHSTRPRQHETQLRQMRLRSRRGQMHRTVRADQG